jgi:hypothetical protein
MKQGSIRTSSVKRVLLTMMLAAWASLGSAGRATPPRRLNDDEIPGRRSIMSFMNAVSDKKLSDITGTLDENVKLKFLESKILTSGKELVAKKLHANLNKCVFFYRMNGPNSLTDGKDILTVRSRDGRYDWFGRMIEDEEETVYAPLRCEANWNMRESFKLNLNSRDVFVVVKMVVANNGKIKSIAVGV